MSLLEHRSSPSTVQFTYSPQPRASSSVPSISIFVEVFSVALKSTICLLLVQWSTFHLDTNKIFGPVLRYMRHILPYNDFRIVHWTGKTWSLTPLGATSILLLAIFLFFSKSEPIGIPLSDGADRRRILPDHSLVGSTDDDSHALPVSKSLQIYTGIPDWWCFVIRGIQGDGSTILSCCCRTWRGEGRSCVSGMNSKSSSSCSRDCCQGESS